MDTHEIKTGLSGSTLLVPEQRIVSLKLSVRAHINNSPKEHALRLIYSKILFAGSGNYTRSGFQDALGNLGSSISVSVDNGDVDFSLHSMDTSLSKSIHLFEDLFFSPTFSQKELLRIKTYLQNKFIEAKEDAKSYAYQSFISSFINSNDRRAVYTSDQLQNELGTITRADIMEFHNSIWKYNWIYTAGGSKKSLHQVIASLSKIRAHKKFEGTDMYSSKQLLLPATSKVLLHDIPSKHNIEFSIGGALPITQKDNDYPAFAFGMNVLGLYGGFTGRLMSIVREKEGLTYGIYGRSEKLSTVETGVWRIMTFFNPKDAVLGITSTVREIDKISKKGITGDELSRFKKIMSTKYALINDSLMSRISEKHALAKIGISDTAYTAFKKDTQNLTVKEVNKALKKYLKPGLLIISGAGPIETVQKDLLKFNK